MDSDSGSEQAVSAGKLPVSSKKAPWGGQNSIVSGATDHGWRWAAVDGWQPSWRCASAHPTGAQKGQQEARCCGGADGAIYGINSHQLWGNSAKVK